MFVVPVMRGYLNKPDETSQTLTDGWLHTGDIAMMDADGYFFIVDRKKDMIICGGYNVYPRDIEEVFFSHPKVQEATAIGIPHPTRGETVKVFVVLKSGQTATAEELIEYARETWLHTSCRPALNSGLNCPDQCRQGAEKRLAG